MCSTVAPRRATLSHYQLKLVTRTIECVEVDILPDGTYVPVARTAHEERVRVIPSPLRGIDVFEMRITTPDNPFEGVATRLRDSYGIGRDRLHISAR